MCTGFLFFLFVLFLLTFEIKVKMAGRMSNKRRRCRSKLAHHRFTVKKERQWKEVLEEMETFDISNTRGHTRSINENNLVIGSVRMALSIFLKFVDEKSFSIHDVTWTMIDNLVASNLMIKRDQVTSFSKMGYYHQQLK